MSAAAAPACGTSRLLRAGLVAAVAVGAGSLAHAAGGGCLTVVPVAGLCVVVAAATWTLAATELTGPVLLLWLGLTQLLAHAVLQAACADEAGPARHSAAMTAAHLGGLALAAAAMRLGEAGLWARRRLARVMRRVVQWIQGLRPGLVTPPPHSCLLPPQETRIGRWSLGFVLGGLGRRGPPVGLLST